jgi:8-amino-7-oxononanoate synthase
MNNVTSELEQLVRGGLKRVLLAPHGLDLSSNDFLGLSQSMGIRNGLANYLAEGGALGSTGSRLVSGESSHLIQTELFVAGLFAQPAALFFGSGYLANLGAIGALVVDGCEFFSDRLNHASLIDGMRLSRSKVSLYQHNDLEHLSRLLRHSRSPRKIVVCESVFSQDGDGPDLGALKDLVDEAGAFLVLDEAHATGVCGPNGWGQSEGLAFDPERTLIVHTCGKALGGYGAFITSGVRLRELMIHKARSFIYSTAPSPLQILQTKLALCEIRDNPSKRTDLQTNIMELRALDPSAVARHIVAIRIKGNERVVAAAEYLMERGFFVRAIRSPTVAVGEERLRITVKSFHSRQVYRDLISCLTEVL